MDIFKKINSLILMLFISLLIMPITGFASGTSSLSIHLPSAIKDETAIYRMWEVTGDDKTLSVTELNKVLSSLTETEVEARYGQGKDTNQPISRITYVTNLKDVRYYFRLKSQFSSGNIVYFLIDFPVVEDGAVYNNVTIYPKTDEINEEKSSLQILKLGVSDKDKLPLKGVTFNLDFIRPDGLREPVRTNLETDETGVIIVTDLEPGSYIITETKPLPGYMTVKEQKVITTAGDRTYITIENRKKPDKTPPTIPETGDTLQFLLMGSGILVSLGGFAIYMKKDKKEEE